MQLWLAETLAGRAECVSHAIFFILCCLCADVKGVRKGGVKPSSLELDILQNIYYLRKGN